MVGVTDLVLWDRTKKSFEQLAPKEVKLLITESGKASKIEVAEALPRIVGEIEYKTDDESDAVAVGVAWLLKNKYPVVMTEETRK